MTSFGWSSAQTVVATSTSSRGSSWWAAGYGLMAMGEMMNSLARGPKSGGARVTVDYGYDVHTILVPQRTLARIQAGVPLTTKGQGFPVKGVMEQDHWAFNYDVLGAIHVSTDMGRDVFEGQLGDAEVATSKAVEG